MTRVAKSWIATLSWVSFGFEKRDLQRKGLYIHPLTVRSSCFKQNLGRDPQD